MGEGRTDEPQTNQRLTVAQAATRLGITEGAVRSRIKRGTLPTTKEGGAVFVLLGGGTSTANQPPHHGEPADQSELVAVLREQLALEREANRENRRIIAALTSRIPQLEAPASEATEAPQAPETVEEAPGGAEPRPTTGEAQEAARGPQARPWWRRWLGG